MERQLEMILKVGAAQNFWSTYDVEELNIKSLFMNDGPHGIRSTKSSDIIVTDNENATCFPTSSALAATWNIDLIKQVGTTIGKEARAHGINVLLGPGINLKRSPLGGRNFEYYSEDQFLTSEIAASYVSGVQSQGVAACLKHYVLNEQEVERMTINCIIDEFSLFNTFIKPFREIIREANPMLIMASYNKVNGDKVAESKYLLNDILRGILKYDGAIVSDWGAVENPVKALKAGIDFDMPYMGEYQKSDIASELSKDIVIKQCLEERFMRVKALTNSIVFDSPMKIDYDEHYNIAKKVAEESIVLLRNNKNILPLSKQSNIGIVGSFFKNTRIQGAGSSKVKPFKQFSFKNAIDTLYKEVKYDFLDIDMMRNDDKRDDLIREFAKKHEILFCFTGLNEMDESEGIDRKTLKLDDTENNLINILYEANNNLIVALNNGTAVEFDQIDNVDTLIEAWLSGEGIGEAFWNIVFGDVNPSGKLSETFPYANENGLCSEKLKINPKEILYSEGMLVGYKYYDYFFQDVHFPFGYGLSYSKFIIQNFNLTANDEGFNVSFEIENMSKIDGAEVIQVYYELLNQDYRTPIKELIAFKKVLVKSNQVLKENIFIPYKKFECYDLSIKEYCIKDSEIKLYVGTSSRTILHEEYSSLKSDLKYKIKQLEGLCAGSICREFYTNIYTKEKFIETFSYLNETGLFEIILDMPLNLIARLFPNLIPANKITEMINYLNDKVNKISVN